MNIESDNYQKSKVLNDKNSDEKSSRNTNHASILFPTIENRKLRMKKISAVKGTENYIISVTKERKLYKEIQQGTFMNVTTMKIREIPLM